MSEQNSQHNQPRNFSQQRSVVPTKEQVLTQAEEMNVRFIHLQFSDVVGMVKSVTIPIEQLATTLDYGRWFDGSAIEGFAHMVESDMYLVPDLGTFAILPWEHTTARVICNIHTPKGELFDGDPRARLIKAIQEAATLGYAYHLAPELEFFLLRPEIIGSPVVPQPHDRAGYFDYSTDLATGVRKEMITALQSMGIKIEASHHEGAAGQHEIDLEDSEALQSADSVVTCKYALKDIAQRNDLYATFMPKPIYGLNGSGMHTHIHLLLEEKGENAFSSPSDEYGLSDIARHFIAGLLFHARGMSAILSPLVNSYKRLVPGYEAPVYLSWGRVNRSALVRVPKTRVSDPAATRIELRSPDPSCNPYLAFAVILKAGLDGILNHLPLSRPVEENLYHSDESQRLKAKVGLLPHTLGEALDELRRDSVVREALGEHIFDRFLEAKTQEWISYRQAVHPWELERYLLLF